MDTEHSFTYDDVAPSWWANAIGKALSLMASNLTVLKADATHVTIPASAGNGVALAVHGRWRWIESPITIAHPGGAAGVYPMFATASETSIVSTPVPFTDVTSYAFGAQITAIGATPTIVPGTVDVFRLIAMVGWDGAQITRITMNAPVVGPHSAQHAIGGSDPIAPADIGAVPVGDSSAFQPGDIIWTGASSRIGAIAANGVPVSRSTYATLFGKYGTRFGVGDGSTTFGIPNLAQATMVGAGGSWSAGQLVGELNHALTATEMPFHDHGSLTGNDIPDHVHNIGGTPGPPGTFGATVFNVGQAGVVALAGGGTFAGGGQVEFTNGANVHHQHSIGGAGGSISHNNVQLSQVLFPFIKI